MSANADVLQRSELIEPVSHVDTKPQVETDCKTNHWNSEDFAREQIRILVRRLFFGPGARSVKQVVFSAAEPHIDVAGICDQVARALALETRSQIALVEGARGITQVPHSGPCPLGTSIKAWSTQIAVNLWRVPQSQLGPPADTRLHWLSCLAELRNEFEYAVIHGPAAGISGEAVLLGQLTDGIILVLGAHSTRRATALKIKEALEAAQSRILGTVLSERTFPIPDRIYRRL